MKKRLFLITIILLISVVAFTGCSIFGFGDDDEVSDVTITFETNGGTEIEPISGKPDMLSKKPANPTKEGFTFGGWYEDKELTKEYNYKYFPHKDITIYAKWRAKVNLITFYGNGGNGTRIDSYKTGEECALPSDWTKLGFTFDGWYLNEDLTGDKVTNIKVSDAGDLDFYAKWVPNNYKLTFNSNGGSIIGDQIHPYMSEILEPMPIKEGFVFGGWYLDEGLKSKFTFNKMPLGDKTLYAKWLKSFKITYMRGDTILSSFDETQNEIVLPSPNNTNYNDPDCYFNGWYYDKNLSKKCPDQIYSTEDIVVYSKWTSRGFMPYIEKFETFGGFNNPIIIDNENIKEDYQEMIALADYIIFKGDTLGKYFKFNKDKISIIDSNKLLMKENKLTTMIRNNSLYLAVGTDADQVSGKYKIAVADKNTPGMTANQYTDNYQTLKESNPPIITKISNALVPIPKKLRNDNYDDFKYKTLYKDELNVETSNQLFYALENGYLPVVKQNSSAEAMLNKAKVILRDICDDTMSDFNKLYAIYCYLVENVNYDHYAVDVSKTSALPVSNTYDSWHIEGVLNNHKAVCDGIAKTAVLLARIEGIPCVRVTGSGHAWNKVYIDIDNNGVKEWYNMDATWGNSSNRASNTERFNNENFLFHDAYKTNKERIASNQKDIEAVDEVDSYKLLKYDYKGVEYDLYIESLNELEILANYLHEYINQKGYAINKIVNISIKLGAKLMIQDILKTFGDEITDLNNKSNIDIDANNFQVFTSSKNPNLISLQLYVK